MSDQPTREEGIKHMAGIIKDIRFALLTTTNAEGHLHARPMTTQQTEFDGDVRACDVHISNLRQKVEIDAQRPELVVTVRGVGYKFAV